LVLTVDISIFSARYRATYNKPPIGWIRLSIFTQRSRALNSMKEKILIRRILILFSKTKGVLTWKNNKLGLAQLIRFLVVELIYLVLNTRFDSIYNNLFFQ
jgi:hypothetical protein